MKEYYVNLFDEKIKIEDNFILNFSKILLNILDKELLKGNYICEISKNDWSNKKPESKMIFLANPFFTNPQIDLKGIEYREVNDPHYWKAEYHDINDNSFLCCKYGDYGY
ncbi:MAG: hypothetical protein FWH29_10025 [Methanobrevibacter sp.]|nr:hypothetical protein [Methanobrevibacter sp.]